MKPQKLPFEPGALQAVANAAARAKAQQIAEMKAAKNPLEAFWAGSITASIVHHVQHGAEFVIDAVLPNAPSDAALENLGSAHDENPAN